ncbi:DUF6282 family protein [Microvirga massiliensis]|uniref:DUF6282 family protein n=1 Tax=Microvirga massiliensis TaxID=1033741 RepID=UPI00062BD829|nr:DUF6282 family protein [Microvirga massiliensis]
MDASSRAPLTEREALGLGRLPGADLLAGAVDGHVHACPHINSRSLDVFEAVRQAAHAGLSGLGLMDNFANSAGFAALARRQLGHLGVDVWGGLIMEPPAGGVSADMVRIALAYGYEGEGARFISLPTHHTRHIARLEGRSPAYVEACFEVPERGLPDPLPEIFDLIAASNVVFNTGHVSGDEAVRLVEAAKRAGITRILVPCSHYDENVVQAVTSLGAYAEFSFFFATHATQAGLTHVDTERHTVPPVAAPSMVQLIRAAVDERAVLSSDCGVFLLPPPVEGLREFLLLLETCGIQRAALRRMVADNPRALFRVRTT